MKKEKNIEICPCCGRKMVTYQHRFNKLLLKGLRCLKKAGGVATLGSLKTNYSLTPSEYNNFQKLQYFGLVRKEGRKYILTECAEDFLKGKCGCPSYVKTRLKDVTEYGPEIMISGVSEKLQEREEYEEQASRS